MPTEDFLVEDGLSQRVQTIEAEPHIHRIQCYEHTRGRRNAQRRVPRSNRFTTLAGRGSRQRTVRPERATTSIAHGLDGVVGKGASLTSRNTTGAGRLAARLAFVSHQFNVANAIPYCWENAARVRPLRRNCSTISSRWVADTRRCGQTIPWMSMPPAYRAQRDYGRCTPLTAYIRKADSSRVCEEENLRQEQALATPGAEVSLKE